MADMALRISDLEKSIAAVRGQQSQSQVHSDAQSQSQSNGSGRYGIWTSPAPSGDRVASAASRTFTSITSATPSLHLSVLDNRDNDYVLIKNGTSK
ncbi:hypothetical protein H0G86_002585 [Trichoderma simmonsii]|uniref:Uncharacterized protein n=1 Tax=Trichoderma simmonsii TaxID=1491479 RepID=A0A8G0L8V6_9HYPO|nr:hypothetical protein H0G86_002585 [Trichoderma simmonsii]